MASPWLPAVLALEIKAAQTGTHYTRVLEGSAVETSEGQRGMSVQAGRMRKLVYLLYALSGFVSLGYQVAWFRIFVDRSIRL